MAQKGRKRPDSSCSESKRNSGMEASVPLDPVVSQIIRTPTIPWQLEGNGVAAVRGGWRF